MRPSRRLLTVLFAWMLFGLGVFAARVIFPATQSGVAAFLSSMWWFCAAVLAFAVIWDFIRQRRFAEISISRELPHSMALGVYAKVQLDIYNGYTFPVHLEFNDLYPKNIAADNLPIQLSIAPKSHRHISYPILPQRRGEARFGPSGLRVSSRWGLWQKRGEYGEPQSVKVYPNFAPIANAASIGLEQQILQMGLHLQQRRGEGSDFHQLREFREGDSMRQIDWKATARARKAISREYQDERDQEVYFLLDCGRRLRAKDDHISHFDHALNALLLTSYVALRQGDGVGLMSFAGEPRWLSPVKGPSRINTLLNQLYDLHSSTETSDYLQAAQQFLIRNSKRALVVVVTNAREEDIEDLSAATQLLAKKHIVMVANLRDIFLDQRLQQPVVNFNRALNYCGAIDHAQRRKRVLAKLRGAGTIITDSLPHKLHIDLVNEYLKLKRSGRI